MTTEDKLLKLIKLADAMYYAAQYLTTDASRLHKAMDEYHKFIINEYYKEEPVSEDNNLRKASEEYLKVLSETPYNNTPITNAQTIVRELITFLDIPSKYNPNHIEEPVREELPHIRHRDTLDEFAYQCAYDLSNDWAKETPEWKDVKTACKLGAQWQKQRDNIPSNDLEELINKLNAQFPEVSFAKLSRIAVRVAKWQKEQFEKNRLKHCNSITNEQAGLEQGFIDQHIDKYNRMPTFLDAIEYGMGLQKEQMMAKAIDGGCFSYKNGFIHISCDIDEHLTDIKMGDKVKVIVIKED